LWPAFLPCYAAPPLSQPVDKMQPSPFKPRKHIISKHFPQTSTKLYRVKMRMQDADVKVFNSKSSQHYRIRI